MSTMRRLGSRCVVAVALMMGSPALWAFYKVQQVPAATPAGRPQAEHTATAVAVAAAASAAQRVRQIGAPGAVTATNGFGHAVPLKLAGPMIIPPHWHFRVDNRRIDRVPVTWPVGAPWLVALLRAQTSVRYVVDWNTHSVSAFAWPPVPRVWRLAGGRSLRAQIMGWGHTSGWTVIFHGRQDWLVPAPATFTGPFPAVVEHVVHIARAEGAIIHAVVYAGNNTIVIQEGK